MDPTVGRQWWYFDIGKLSDHTRGDGDDFITIDGGHVFGTELEARQHVDSRMKYWEGRYSDQRKGSDDQFPYFCSDQGRFALSELVKPTGDVDPENPKY